VSCHLNTQSSSMIICWSWPTKGWSVTIDRLQLEILLSVRVCWLYIFLRDIGLMMALLQYIVRKTGDRQNKFIWDSIHYLLFI
jgi:hypothetical protein